MSPHGRRRGPIGSDRVRTGGRGGSLVAFDRGVVLDGDESAGNGSNMSPSPDDSLAIIA
jgi:hypothetical protein